MGNKRSKLKKPLTLLLFVAFISCYAQDSLSLYYSTDSIPDCVLREFKDYYLGEPLNLANPDEVYQDGSRKDPKIAWAQLIYWGKSHDLGFVYFRVTKNNQFFCIKYTMKSKKRLKEYEVFSLSVLIIPDDLIKCIQQSNCGWEKVEPNNW